jgi:two-component system nitrogen regulation response regulator GlnG
MKSVWIVEDDATIAWVLKRALESRGFFTRSFETADDALEAIDAEQPDLVISDVRMPGIHTGFDFLEILHARFPDLPVIISTAFSDMDSALSAYQGGAFEYLPKPFDINDAISMVDKALQASAPIKKTPLLTRMDSKNQSNPFSIIGDAPAMQEVFRIIARLAHTSVSVLVNGETGTGKELVARALHEHSPRKHQSFVAINSAAISKELLESELFGHEKGAFTGAHAQRIGRFEQANGGTLFLDEIGDMPLDLQTRLLRVLSYGEFHRVGGNQIIKTDVRVIAATHQDLQKLVDEGRFREDLYHRLNVIRIYVPPLRERPEDVAQLMQFHLERSAREMGLPCKRLSKSALARLQNYPWKGNVRELANVCMWLTVMVASQEVAEGDLPVEIIQPLERGSESSANHGDWLVHLRSWAKQQLHNHEKDIYHRGLEKFEQVLIEESLSFTQQHRQEAAELLGLGRNTLTRKIKCMH